MIGTNHPSIRFVAVLDLVTPIETVYPKYRLNMWGGSETYKNMLVENFTGKESRKKDRKGVYIVLKPHQTKKTSAPEMNLQLNNGQNLTGLKQWFDGGRLSGYAYGEPQVKEAFGEKNPKTNCFFPYRTDGYLLRCTPSSDPTNVIPTQIVWIVLKGGEGVRIHSRQYLTLLKMGGFNQALAEINLNPID